MADPVAAPAALAAPAVQAPAAPAASTTAAPAAAPAADPKAAAAASAADPKGGSNADPQKGYWPEDWQKRLAGEDEKALKQVARYASPEEVWKKARALEQRLSSGDLRPALPKNAKPEELTAWRKDNGIPEKADGYDLKGIEIPEQDRPVIGGIVAKLHGVNATPEVVRTAVKVYYEEQARQVEQRATLDEQQRVSALDTLNQEYGGQFRRNVNLVEGVLSKFPQSVRDALKAARLPDGTALFNNADAVRGFVALALEMNPAGIVAPAGGGDMAQTMLDQYKAIQTEKIADRKAFNKDAAKQEHERNLIDAMIKNGLMDKNGNLIQQQRKAA